MATLRTLKEKLPLMRSGKGHRLRNIIVASAYAFVLLTLITAAMNPSGTNDAIEGENAPSSDSGGETSNATNASTNESGAGTAQANATEATTEAPTPPTEPAEEPVKTTEEQAEQAGESGSDGPGPADMERVLASEGIDVDIHETANGDLHANYYSTASDKEELAADLGAIAGTYSAVVDGGHPSEQLTIEIRTNAGQPVGEYVVTASDAQAFANGDITAEEYARRVLSSGEVYEDAQSN